MSPFDLVCEVEPPTRPDLMRVRHQIGVMSRVASAFLIPDNHLGRATVSSIAVAHEVEAMGGRSIACLNGRDRNLLGLRRDLLTAVAYGVERFLLVAGDRGPDDVGGLRVRAMLDEVRTFATSDVFDTAPPFQLGVASQLRPLPDWKRAADFVFVQVSFDVDALRDWRESIDFDGPVYAGVMVLASAAHAARIAADIPQITVPPALHEQLGRDPDAGVAAACDLVDEIRGLGTFRGVHLVPVGRYREVAARLERDLRTR